MILSILAFRSDIDCNFDCNGDVNKCPAMDIMRDVGLI
jgi:hypothetical protein